MARSLSANALLALLIGISTCLLMGSAILRAQDDRAVVRLHFPKTDVRDVLLFYGRLVRKPVLMEVDMQALVTVDHDQELTHKAAVELIRKTLLESYGIEMRDSDRGEVLVTWSLDPKYPRRRRCCGETNGWQWYSEKENPIARSRGEQMRAFTF